MPRGQGEGSEIRLRVDGEENSGGGNFLGKLAQRGSRFGRPVYNSSFLVVPGMEAINAGAATIATNAKPIRRSCIRELLQFSCVAYQEIDPSVIPAKRFEFL
jgi:hypothetical protein